MKIEPCDHAADHPDAHGDLLRYSCRRMRVALLDEVAMAFLRNIDNSA